MTEYIVLDLSDTENLGSIVEKTIQVFGKIDVLGNTSYCFSYFVKYLTL